jgi:rod shape determining protein RodA
MGLFRRKSSQYQTFDRQYSSRVNRSFGGRFDWTIAVITVLLICAGLVNLYSAVYGMQAKGSLFANQIRWLAICAFIMIFIYLVNYHVYEAGAFWLYGITVFLLVLTLLVGQTTKGSSRWLGIGSFTFQPSELSKIALVIALARFFTQKPKSDGYKLKELFVPFLLVLAPSVLIIREPDLGTTILHVLVFASMCLFVGVKRKSILTLATLVTASVPTAWFLLMKEYQRERILTLFNPDRDPLGAGYHIRQSLIAVGSGKLFGKGFMNGTQTKLQFLPETHTDFIFSVLAEEWGFIGCVIVLALFFFLIAWAISVSAKSKDRFGSIAAFGLASILFWQVVINVGMVVNLAPVVGVVLPFFSYGRTAAFSMLCVVTLLLNINSRRYMFE